MSIGIKGRLAIEISMDKKNTIELVKPHSRYQASFMAAFNELTTDSDRISWIYMGEAGYKVFFNMSFADYVNTLLISESTPSAHFVKDTTYWAVKDDEVVGRISLRHELNEFLAKIGGHIGYIVAQSHRQQGFAGDMLQRLLATPKAKDIGKLLLTCDENNVASEKTITKNGGIFESLISAGPGKGNKKRFWINV